MKLTTICEIAFGAVSMLSATPASTAEFFGLGRAPGVVGDNWGIFDLTSYGAIGVGSGRHDPDHFGALRWTVEDGYEWLSCGNGDWECNASDASTDGSVIVGWKREEDGVRMPVRWTDASGMEELAVLPGYTSCQAIEVSDDGSVAAGRCWDQKVVVRWTDNGMESLGLPGDATAIRNFKVRMSSDGSVIAVGVDWYDGPDLAEGTWLWREQSGYEYIGPGRSTDITPDGSVVVGWSTSAYLTFRWTKETGMDILPYSYNQPKVSPDGSVMFATDGAPLGAVLRYADNEVQELRELLISDYGLANELQGWELRSVKDTLVDSRTIVGRGINPDGETEPWMVILDPLLHAGDADHDFDFDQLDLVQVQVAGKYLSGEPATWGEGDWNGSPVMFDTAPPVGDGVFNQLDIVAAQQAGLYLTGSYAGVQGDAFVAAPEPSGLTLAVVSVFGLLHRRRRSGTVG